jgi:hypothetical protein
MSKVDHQAFARWILKSSWAFAICTLAQGGTSQEAASLRLPFRARAEAVGSFIFS